MRAARGIHGGVVRAGIGSTIKGLKTKLRGKSGPMFKADTIRKVVLRLVLQDRRGDLAPSRITNVTTPHVETHP